MLMVPLLSVSALGSATKALSLLLGLDFRRDCTCMGTYRVSGMLNKMERLV